MPDSNRSPPLSPPWSAWPQQTAHASDTCADGGLLRICMLIPAEDMENQTPWACEASHHVLDLVPSSPFS